MVATASVADAEQALRKAFALIDDDGSGTLSPEELGKLLGKQTNAQ